MEVAILRSYGYEAESLLNVTCHEAVWSKRLDQVDNVVRAFILYRGAFIRNERITDKLCGKDRSWISQNFPGSFIGTMPRGEMTRSRIGGNLKGHAVRDRDSSLVNMSIATLTYRCRAGPWNPIENPTGKPWIKNDTTDWLYPAR